MLCVAEVEGVTQLHNVVYIVRAGSSAILRFNATTHQRLEDIRVKGMSSPCDIVACEQTSQLYVVDWAERCVWRVSEDGADIKLWLTKSSTGTVRPHSLSVVSARLLLTCRYTKQVMQFDSLGDELRRVQFPDHVEPWHAVESPTSTFIVSHKNMQLKQISSQLDQFQISEIDTEGQVLRQFTGSHPSSLGFTQQIAIDSHGNIFVADHDNRCIWLLGAQLTPRRAIIDKRQLDNKPRRVRYVEPTGQLLVGLYDRVSVFDVLRH